MKIALIERLPGKCNYVGKDQNAGYGANTYVGDSILARILTLAKKRKRRIPFLLLGYLASILQNNGHEVIIINGNEPPEVDLIVMPTSIVDCKNEVEFGKRIKRERKGTKVGLIGPFAGVKPEYYKDSYDFIISGEPEQIFMSITDSKIPDGYVVSEPIKDLDSLPFPNWDLFPVDQFGYKPILLKKPMLPILSSRGCVYKCDYCAYRVYYSTYRKRSPQKVVEEIKYLKERYGIRAMIFRDPLFTGDPKRTKKIAELIIKEHLNDDFEWACETRLDLISEDAIDLYYDSGMRGLNVGIESFDPDIMKKAERISINVAHQNKIINHCHKKGIRVAAFYILGLEEDTEESIEKTIEYSKKLNTLVAQYSINTPLPGTPLFEKLIHKIYEKDWQKYSCLHPVFKHDNLSKKQLLKLKEKAWVSYYFRLGYFMKHLKTIIS